MATAPWDVVEEQEVKEERPEEGAAEDLATLEKERKKGRFSTLAKVVVLLVVIAVAYQLSRFRTSPEGGTEAPSQDPMGVVLAAADVPAGFAMYGQGYIYAEHAADMCGASADAVKGWGYSAGYYTDFRSFPSSIYSAALIFSGSEGAGLAYTSIRDGIDPTQRLNVPQKIGDERCGAYSYIPPAVWENTVISGGSADYEVVFRKGNTVARIRVGGRPGVFSLDNAVAYALIVEGRIL